MKLVMREVWLVPGIALTLLLFHLMRLHNVPMQNVDSSVLKVSFKKQFITINNIILKFLQEPADAFPRSKRLYIFTILFHKIVGNQLILHRSTE